MPEAIDVAVFLPGQSLELVGSLGRERLLCNLLACSTEKDVRERMATATVLVSTPVAASTLEPARKLEWIQSLSAGVEGWLNSAPTNIPITRMTGVYERYMAEYVFAHLLYDSQKLAQLADGQARRSWEPVNTRSLSGLKLGVAGLGHVGSEVARLGKAFGLHVRGLGRTSGDPPKRGEGAVEAYFDRSGLYEFLSGLDVLVLTLPATPETDRMFGHREFMTLPRGATVVNVGRGQAIDEVALVEALRSGQVGRAVIDTFLHEPLPKDSPIWDAPNMTITPHMAGAVYPDELAQVIAPNIRAFLGGQIPEPTVNRAAGY
jgi:phosphoglycerate dehydrogenase-like enzyme